ncbi:hypothetical protein [Virgibacillus sp.]|uniref:hypothetical protein n=1 Tax=Virgibacillus sp. TaxID=1872700 RepID=UPI0017F68261|nr:hypothetical protein [Virgibacillus sp.]NWO12693.1 hypothetical protein [Virgibacillus sp.]
MLIFKSIIAFILFALALGSLFYLIVNSSEKKLWRIVNISLGSGVILLFPITNTINAFKTSYLAGLQFTLFYLSLFSTALLVMVIMSKYEKKFNNLFERMTKNRVK